jgi:hypothetical protein
MSLNNRVLKLITSAVVFIFLSTTAHFLLAQTILSDTLINDQFVFRGEYSLHGNVTFGVESELHFTGGTEILLLDSTCLNVFGSISYAADFDTVSVINSQGVSLSAIEIHFYGQVGHSIALLNWTIADILLRPQVQYPDSLAILNFHNYEYLTLDNVKVDNCGIVQVDDNAITRTFGALVMNNIDKVSIKNSTFNKCHSSNTGGALTICNSDSIYLLSSRFYNNVGIDSAETGQRLLFWGQGSSCSVDISNKYLEVNSCVFAFNRESVTTTYFSANNTIIDGCIFYDNSRSSLLSQASVQNNTLVQNTSFVDCVTGIIGGPNIIAENCVIQNRIQRDFRNFGFAVNYSLGAPQFESKNVYFLAENECRGCGDGFIPYDNFEDVFDTLSVSQIDGYLFLGLVPSVDGLLVDESSKPCSSSELDILLESRCIGSAPDIGAVELQQTVSVEEVIEEDVFSLYPNPTSDQLYIESLLEWDAKSALIIDVSGKAYPLSIESVSGKLKLLSIPEGLSPGLYIVTLTGQDEVRRIGKVLVKHNR